MDRGAWQAIVHGVTKSQSLLSEFHFFILLFISINKNNYFQTKSISIKVLTLLGKRQDVEFFQAPSYFK